MYFIYDRCRSRASDCVPEEGKHMASYAPDHALILAALKMLRSPLKGVDSLNKSVGESRSIRRRAISISLYTSADLSPLYESTCSKGTRPKFVFIGTHKDLEQECPDENREEKN